MTFSSCWRVLWVSVGSRVIVSNIQHSPLFRIRREHTALCITYSSKMSPTVLLSSPGRAGISVKSFWKFLCLTRQP
jgi:hypothetical protein